MPQSIQPKTMTYQTTKDLERVDFAVESDPGSGIFVRSVIDPQSASDRVPVVLLHGARASSVPSFDLDVQGGSLAADLAWAGHPVYLMDARGFGGSTRQPALNRPPEESQPLTRSSEVVRDISAVVEHVREYHEVAKVTMMGWATGSQWLSHYAATSPDTVSHLVLYNAVWPVAGEWPLGEDLEDPENPGELRPGALHGYGFATAEALLTRWDASIPTPDPADWRDPHVADAYLASAISMDPTARDRSPPSFRTPLGALADTFYLTRGKRPFDPSRITAHVLVLRSENDFWSRAIDACAPVDDLTSAATVRYVEIPGGTHYAHLDRPERGRDFLIENTLQFLSSRH